MTSLTSIVDLNTDSYTGYHVELCQTVLMRIRRELKAPELTIQYLPVTSANRLPLLLNGTIDIECGTTTNNLTRQKDVAFAFTTFVTEIRIAVKANSGISSIAQLSGKNVVSAAGSTVIQTLRQYKRGGGADFKELTAKDHAESFLLLESGRADAWIQDDNILAGNIASSKSPNDFKLIGEPLAVEPIAIAMRKNEPEFVKAVNGQLAEMMRTGELERIYEKWFVKPIPPRNAVVGLPMSKSLKANIDKSNDLPAESYISR